MFVSMIEKVLHKVMDGSGRVSRKEIEVRVKREEERRREEMRKEKGERRREKGERRK